MNTPDRPHDEPGKPRMDKPADASGTGRVARQADQRPEKPTGGPDTTGEDSGGDRGSAGAHEEADEGTGAVGAEFVAGGSGSDHPHVGEDGDAHGPQSSDVGEGAGAVVAAGLGAVSLSGSWLGTVAGARESLIGQLQTPRGASVARQIREVYGAQWHAIALVGGAFALLALLVGVAVLARPAFGSPGRSQAPWIKAVSWAGVLLGVVGLLLAVLKYTDAILALPSVQS